MASSNPMDIDETMSNHPDADADNEEEEEEAMLNPDDAAEEIPEDADAPMDSDEEDDPQQQEIQLTNDSIAHFDIHKDSIFCIAQHPAHPNIIATGSGDNHAYIFDCTPASTPTPNGTERASLQPLFQIDGHPESVNAITFTKPHGQYILSAGINGELRAYVDPSASATSSGDGKTWKFLAEAKEVDEINFLIPCPHPAYPNTVALGAKDGSIWVYTVDAADAAAPLSIVQAFYPGGEGATAGAWTPDGKLLCTVSEDSSFFAWDVFGEASAAGVNPGGQQQVVALTAADERFKSEGGLYSVAVAPNGSFAAVGGADGSIKIVGLPRLGAEPASKGGAGAKGKAGGSKQGGGSSAGAGQAGTILATLQAQDESVETIAFAPLPSSLMAAGSVDGYVTLFDTARNFAMRRKLEGAHEGQAVVKVEFVETQPHLLTTCGLDGVVRRWDTRGGTAAAGGGLVGEWRGHVGGGDGGGVLGFVQGGGGRAVVTAGDDGVSLVFDMSQIPQPSR